MYEKLDKLREEVSRCEKRAAYAQNRLQIAQEKLKEAEATQILADVGAMKLTPEALAKVLAMAKSGLLKFEEQKIEPTEPDLYPRVDASEEADETDSENEEMEESDHEEY